MSTKNPTSSRLVSLDVLRGLTIIGMIIVNDPGSWSYVYPPLRHADWHGITPTDMVFPFFLFIVGVSIVLAYHKRIRSGKRPADLIGKIFRRTLIIFVLGLLLWLIPGFDWSGLRIPGVLQRIALVFLACSLLYLYTNWRQQAWIGAGLLVGYWILMCFVPVPIDETIRLALETGQVKAQAGMLDIGPIHALSEGWIAANLEPGTNLQAWLDRQVIPGRLWQYTWDPEGLLSTLPSIGSGICGMLAGHWWLSKNTEHQRIIGLFLGGFLCFLAGSVWDWFFPINKNLWTSSFVLYTSGLAMLSLATCIWIVDVKGHRRWAWVAIVFGMNAIFAYVLHGLIGDLFRMDIGGGTTIQGGFMDGLMGAGIPGEAASLLWALLYTALVFLPTWWLYRKRIFLKV